MASLNDFNIVEYYDNGQRGGGANSLKFWLMPFVCFVLYGFPFPQTIVSSYITVLSRFAAPAFFILCGFFVLPTDREVRLQKLSRAVRKSAGFFFSLFIVYLTVNIIYLQFKHVYWVPEVFRLRILFNFFVLNMWPFSATGASIWFIQSLFYAYALLWVADRFNLLRFYKVFMAILFVIMLLCGEFAGMIRLESFTGYPFIPGGAITRALPYLLLGMFIREKAAVFLKPRKIVYLMLIIAGFALAYGEVMFLGATGYYVYSGHLIGLGLVAAALCCWALSLPRSIDSFSAMHGRSYSKRIYAIAPLAAFTLMVVAGMFGDEGVYLVTNILGISAYLLSLLLTYDIRLLLFSLQMKKVETEEAALAENAENEDADADAREVQTAAGSGEPDNI